MAYQLANEPRAMRSVAAYRRWIAESAALIKRLSPEHLVTTGSEGRTPFAFSYVGLDPASDHAIDGVDYMTIHVRPTPWHGSVAAAVAAPHTAHHRFPVSWG